MRKIVKSLALCVASLGFALATPEAKATLLLSGGTAVPNAQSDPLSATILADTGVQNFNVSMNGDSMSGTGQAWVVTGFSSNPFGAADLTFAYQVSLTGGSTATGEAEIIERITASSFGSFSTDVGYHQQTAAQVIPPSANRSANGAIIGFDYTTTPILIGQTTALLIVNTNAAHFMQGTLTAQDGLTVSLSGFSPTLVPEPGTMGAALTGLPCLALLGVLAQRRRKSNP